MRILFQLRCGFVLLGSVLLLIGLEGGCASSGGPHIVTPQVGSDWKPALTVQQIATVRQTFPVFLPALYAPGFGPMSPPESYSPSNLNPEQFFGRPHPQGFKPTPLLGILLEANGFDGTQVPDPVPTGGTYYDSMGNPYTLDMNVITRCPLNILRGYMNLAPDQNAPLVSIDPTRTRVSPAEIDSFMMTLRSQFAMAIPAIANVDPRNAEIVIEPSYFYVSGIGYARGFTEQLDNAHYKIHLSVFDIDRFKSMSNWQDVMVDEALNFYVFSTGNPNLAH
jgi:hypothetical protein